MKILKKKIKKKDFVEQRKTKRVPIRLRVDYQCKDNYLFEYSSNLSEHGIFITTANPLQPGTKLELQFSINEGKDEIHTTGEVIWVNKPTHDSSSNAGMGVRFLDIDDDSQEKLKNLIKRIAVLKGVLDENM